MKFTNKNLFILQLILVIFLFPALLINAFAGQEFLSGRTIAAKYGIDCDNAQIEKNIIKSNDNLAEILLAAGVSYNKIDKAVKKSKNIFDVRKIRPGKSYCIISTPGQEVKDCYFIYEQNSVDYVVFDLGEHIEVYKDKKVVDVRTCVAEGTIESSLSDAFAKQHLDYDLAIKLAEIYAWTLDFYHFHKGDKFKIIFEESYVENKPVSTGRILAALITHAKEDFYAFYFKSDKEKTGQYFDENGESLKNAFLKAPLKFFRISSGYNKNRLHPILHQHRPHLGIDYAAPRGTPIMSVGDGVVEKAAYNSSAGKYLQIRHNRTYMTQYLHVSKYAKDIRPGKRVSQGEIIGYVGSTGLATGPHLDFRFWVDGKAVNFLKQDIPTADPVDPSLMEYFNVSIASFKTYLDTDKTRYFSAEVDFDKNG